MWCDTENHLPPTGGQLEQPESASAVSRGRHCSLHLQDKLEGRHLALRFPGHETAPLSPECLLFLHGEIVHIRCRRLSSGVCTRE